MLFVDPTVVLPEPGKAVPIPSMKTDALGSDDCHDRVTGMPEHTLFLDRESVTLGSVQAPTEVPGATARRRPTTGGGLGRVIGAKLIAVTGCNSIPFGATPRCP